MKLPFIILVLFVLTSCSPDFSKPRYAKRFCISNHGWKRRRVLVVNTGTYRNPILKKEARKAMLAPKKISFDSW